MPDVLVEEGPVATVVLNGSERRNALTVRMARAVGEALEAAAAHARAIVLTVADPAFCGGGDPSCACWRRGPRPRSPPAFRSAVEGRAGGPDEPGPG